MRAAVQPGEVCLALLGCWGCPEQAQQASMPVLTVQTDKGGEPCSVSRELFCLSLWGLLCSCQIITVYSLLFNSQRTGEMCGGCRVLLGGLLLALGHVWWQGTAGTVQLCVGLVLLVQSRNPGRAWEHFCSRRLSRKTGPPQPWESEWGAKKQKLTGK